MIASALQVIESEFVETPAEWPDIETKPVFKTLPEFPFEHMPGILQPMTREISESVQIAPEVAGLALLTITGAAAGRENVFYIKRGLPTRPNLFGLIFVERGGRKSSAYDPVLRPVFQWISDRLPDYKKALNRYFLKLKERDSFEAKLTKSGAKDTAADQLHYETLQANIEDIKQNLRDPAFLADDCTPEGLFELFDRTQGQIALATDDGRTFAKILKGIYNGGESREEIHLRGFDCKNPLIKHRAGKTSAIIDKPFESALVMLQVDFLQKLAEGEDLFQSGFMSRCIFCYPDSLSGRREYSEREISEGFFYKYTALIQRLLQENYSRRIGEDKEYSLDPEAKKKWIEYYNQIEGAIGAGGELENMADIAIRFPEFARKFALITAIVEGRESIRPEDMTRAITLTKYYRAHAERAFSVMKEVSLPDEARRILKTIRLHQLTEFTSRDIERQNGMAAENIQTGITTLASRFYCRLKAEQSEPKGAGRKPSAIYEINPEIFFKK